MIINSKKIILCFSFAVCFVCFDIICLVWFKRWLACLLHVFRLEVVVGTGRLNKKQFITYKHLHFKIVSFSNIIKGTVLTD